MGNEPYDSHVSAEYKDQDMPRALVCPMDHQGGFPRGNNSSEVEPCRPLGISKNECREGGEREEGLAVPG